MPVRFALLLLSLSLPLAAAEPDLGPVINSYGPTFAIEDRDIAMEEGTTYKAVFDVAAYADDMSMLNGRMESVARFLNMHGRHGTPVENMDLALVVHGAAVSNLMTHVAYRKRFGQDNPNLDLLSALHEAGVQIYVCGQSMGFRDIGKEALVDFVDVALSAMTMLTVLQNDGYAFLR